MGTRSYRVGYERFYRLGTPFTIMQVCARGAGLVSLADTWRGARGMSGSDADPPATAFGADAALVSQRGPRWRTALCQTEAGEPCASC